MALTTKMSARGLQGILAPADEDADYTAGNECLYTKAGTYAEVNLPVAVRPIGFSYGWGKCGSESWRCWSFQGYDDASNSWTDLYFYQHVYSAHTRFEPGVVSPQARLQNSKFFRIDPPPGRVYTRFRILSMCERQCCFHPRSLEIYGTASGLKSALDRLWPAK